MLKPILRTLLAYIFFLSGFSQWACADQLDYTTKGFDAYISSQMASGPDGYIISSQNIWKNNSHLQNVILSKGYNSGVGKAMSGYTTNAITESGKAIIIIVVIHVVAVAMAERRRAELMGVEVDDKEFQEMVSRAAEASINNFGLYTGGASVFATGITLAGSSAALKKSEAIRNALDLLDQRIMKSPAAKRHFIKMVGAGAMSLAMFSAGAVGEQLLQESILMEGEKAAKEGLDMDAYRNRLKIAKSLKISKFLFGRWGMFGVEPPSEEEKLVFAKLTQNMFHVLFKDKERRFQLFYNTWRKQIATGDFWTLVVAMTVAGYTGAKVGAAAGFAIGGPVGSTIFAAIFGLGFVIVTGVLIVFVPQNVKDWMTERIRGFRIWANKSNVESRMRSLTDGFGVFKKGFRDYIPGARAISKRWILGLLDNIHSDREYLINAWIERYYHALEVKKVAEYENSIAALSTNPEFLVRIKDLIEIQDNEDTPGATLDDFLHEHAEAVDPLLEEAKRKYSGEKRIELVQKNEALIESSISSMREVESLLLNFYTSIGMRITESFFPLLYSVDEDNGEKTHTFPEAVVSAVYQELESLTVLTKNIQWLVFGLNPALATENGVDIPENLISMLQASSMVKLNRYYEYMYTETFVIENFSEDS